MLVVNNRHTHPVGHLPMPICEFAVLFCILEI